MPTSLDLLEAIRKRIGQPAPINTCQITVDKVLGDIGFAYDRDFTDGSGRAKTNVSDFHELARRKGWVIDKRDAGPGDLLIWPNDSHITVFESLLAGDRIVSIGGGGPSGKVARQPTGGGGNPRSYFAAAIRLPLDPVKPPAASGMPAQTSAENDGTPGAVFWARVDIAMDRDPSLGAGPKGEPGRNREAAVTRIAARDINGKGYRRPNGTLIKTTADRDGIDGGNSWDGYAVHSNTHYGTKLTINGKNGPATQKSRYRIAAYFLNRL